MPTKSSTERKKVKIVTAVLDKLYPRPAIPLRHKDPFTLLISVLLSAQTTDVMVNRVTPTLFVRQLPDLPAGSTNKNRVRKVMSTSRGLKPPEAEVGKLSFPGDLVPKLNLGTRTSREVCRPCRF